MSDDPKDESNLRSEIFIEIPLSAVRDLKITPSREEQLRWYHHTWTPPKADEWWTFTGTFTTDFDPYTGRDENEEPANVIDADPPQFAALPEPDRDKRTRLHAEEGEGEEEGDAE